MGEPYLLQSVGAVVVGGTFIAGGSATALGTFFGSILLVLIVTTMQVSGWSPGMQEVVQGAIIIAILAAAGSGMGKRSA
jgi:ribose transport system permease protein